MKKIELSVLLSFLFSYGICSAQTSIKFEDYFLDKSMRIDYFHIGDAASELVTLDQIYTYNKWPGSVKNLLDNFNNGAYYYKVYDEASGSLIYSKGFDSYFKEYQTSTEALNGIKRTYHESAVIPYPKNKIKFVLEKRNFNLDLFAVYSTTIDPNDIYIHKENFNGKDVTVYQSHLSGDPHVKVDVVILGEGYSSGEREKFERDLKRFTNVFLSYEPFLSFKNNFNIYGVLKLSEESGTDEPGAGIYKSTALNTTFYSLGSERYLLTEDNKALHDQASHAPYDAIYVMVNTPRYGGGGIYNFYCTFASDNQFNEYIFLHEFGHSFGGLADEYYTSDVAYNEFYPANIEPVEPNITRLFNAENLKWRKLAAPGIELPTPWEKEKYDEMDYAWQRERRAMNKNITELKRNKASSNAVEKAQSEYNRKDSVHSAEIDNYLSRSKYWGMVGAFEGAGYSSRGMFRPMIDCLMFSKGTKPFCKVCESHIIKVIKYYSE